MTLRDGVLPIISAGWALVEAFGFAPYTVTIRTRTWSSGKVKLGTTSDADLTLSPNPQVTEADGDKVLELFGITPSNGTIGHTPEQLNPSLVAGVEYYYVVTGPNGTHNYSVASLDTSDPVEYKVKLDALTRAMPF